MRRLVVCHGASHKPRYRDADTVDVDQRAKPTFVADVSSRRFSIGRQRYDRILLHHCPHFVLFTNAERAFQAIFRRPGDTIPLHIHRMVEQEVPRLDPTEEVVFDVARRGESLVAGPSVELARPRREGWFHVDGMFYSNYTILRVNLRPLEHTWLNLYALVDQDGEIVIKAPMPRTYAMMHAPHLSFVNALKSLIAMVSARTGAHFRHKRIRANASFSEFVVPDGARYVEYEAHDWYIEPVPVMEQFTNVRLSRGVKTSSDAPS